MVLINQWEIRVHCELPLGKREEGRRQLADKKTPPKHGLSASLSCDHFMRCKISLHLIKGLYVMKSLR